MTKVSILAAAALAAVPAACEGDYMASLSTRVDKPENDDQAILDRARELLDWQAPLESADS
jgi:hypothetical protein